MKCEKCGCPYNGDDREFYEELRRVHCRLKDSDAVAKELFMLFPDPGYTPETYEENLEWYIGKARRLERYFRRR